MPRSVLCGVAQSATSDTSSWAGIKAGDGQVDSHDRVRNAAFRAKHVLPSGVAELVSRELISWLEYGFGPSKVILDCVKDIEKLHHSNPHNPCEKAVGQ